MNSNFSLQYMKKNNKRILIFMPFFPLPAVRGKDHRVLDMVTYLKKSGHTVHLTCVLDRPVTFYAGIKLLGQGFSFNVAFPDFGKLRLLRHAAAFFLGNRIVDGLTVKLYPGIFTPPKLLPKNKNCHNYIHQHPLVAFVPKNVLTIIDTHDLLYKRADTLKSAQLPVWMEINKKEEIVLLKKFHVILAIQKDEADQLRRLIPDRPVITVPTSFQVLRKPYKTIETKTVMTIGYASDHGVHGLEWFLEKIWPRVHKILPDAVLNIYGRIASCFHSDRKLGIQAVGLVSNATKAYRENRLTINPVLVGSGLKIKTVEALCHGKALVTTAIGSQGIDVNSAPKPVVVADESDFAEKIVELLQNDEKIKQIQRNALKYAMKHFTPETCYSELIEGIETYSS
ncbi:MAG: glycosyltransferase family 4 protein [Deltaproteobacteria bacterium]|nr:glycosyltransferase family 4 protein [Deltaproteobacteria bacterium]